MNGHAFCDLAILEAGTTGPTMLSDLDELDLHSAIWIMANNDETNLITYRGIRQRLSLPDDYDVRALVAKRPELFRQGASDTQVEAWKEKMLTGKAVPPWIRSLENSERDRVIRSLSAEDIFRSQFRVSRDAEKSPVEIISWGLEHLDRIRKARLAVTDMSAKSWQIWLVFLVGIAGIVTQILVAALKR